MKLVKFQNPLLTSWPTFGRFADLQNEMDRLFGAPLLDDGATSALGGWAPPIEILEDKENVVVKAELPGMKKEDISVTLHEGVLGIAGERKAEKKVEEQGLYRSERFFGRFQRNIALPTGVAANKVKADYKDGILTVTLPKTEEAKPRQIDVNVS